MSTPTLVLPAGPYESVTAKVRFVPEWPGALFAADYTISTRAGSVMTMTGAPFDENEDPNDPVVVTAATDDTYLWDGQWNDAENAISDLRDVSEPVLREAIRAWLVGAPTPTVSTDPAVTVIPAAPISSGERA